MNQMTYDNYVKRYMTKGQMHRAVDSSPDMRRFVHAQAVVEGGGREIRKRPKLDIGKVLMTADSKGPEVLKLPRPPENLPAELIGKVTELVRELNKQETAKIQFVEVHPDDVGRHTNVRFAKGGVISVTPKKMWSPVEGNPDRWRIHHTENIDAWVEYEFLGVYDIPADDDDDDNEPHIDDIDAVAKELFERLGKNGDAPKH